jgi:sialate O-acetylesterase
MISVRVFVVLFLSAVASPAFADTSLLGSMFRDHAVLQRDQPIKVWGEAQPSTQVAIALGPDNTVVQSDAGGHWQANLPAMPAGGPYTLRVQNGASEQDAKDILVGDVWLCAGQSNMVLEVHRTLDSRSEIENATNDTIRLLTIEDNASATPLQNIAQTAQWEPASPKSAANFSATCFYFARELQKTVHVPLGLINTAWGGSKIRTWMSEQALRAVGGYGPLLPVLDLYAKDPDSAAQPFGAMWEAWWDSRNPSGAKPWSAAYDAQSWPQAPALGAWDDWGVPELVNHTGTVWYRTSIDLSAAQAAQNASLSIGRVDEVDATWVNGIFVGGGSGGNRTYHLPPGALHAGTNSIAVNILNTYKQGGLLGPANAQGLHFGDGSTAPLPGPWLYDIVPQNVGDPPRAPWESIAGLSMAYNGMVAPLGRYGLRGAIWYQGESDTGEPAAYRAQLSGLMADWRGQFGDDLPFLIVQLPGYGMPPTKPQDSDWAKLREAQREAVAADSHAALVTIIDIGEHYDVHPANKQEVGRRLALAARRLAYGEAVVSTGPIVERATRKGRRVTLSFANVQGGLVTYSSATPIGFELCGTAPNSCRFSTAQIVGDKVDLPVTGKGVWTHVRYCWADGPICTLFDGAGLPAAPFDRPIENAMRAKKGHDTKLRANARR